MSLTTQSYFRAIEGKQQILQICADTQSKNPNIYALVSYDMGTHIIPSIYVEHEC